MAQDLQVQAELRLKDNASKQAATALEQLGKASRTTAQATAAIGASGALKRVVADAASAARQLQDTAAGASDAERRLGGAARGAAALDKALRGARNMSRETAKQFADMGRNIANLTKGAGQIGSGVMAGGAVAAAALQKPVAYESQLASMANVAYAGKSKEGRIAGMKSLDASIVGSVRVGGGSREQAAGALNTLLAAGTEESTAKKLLPLIQKAATASGADANELAMILVKGISQKQFTADEAQTAIDKAIKAGEAGQFELKDMAKWLPQIISAGKGMKGMSGYEAHLANLQGIANVTGSNDQAGNAYFNLLGKITSQDAANAFKKKGINLSAALTKATEQGSDPVTAFVELIQKKVVGKNKRYQALQRKIAATQDKDEKKALMEQAAELLEGSAVGEVIADREAMLGLVGIMSQKNNIADVRSQLSNADGSMEKSFGVMSSTSDYKLQQAKNEKDIAASGLFENLKGPLDAVTSGMTELAQANPQVATAAYGAATALGAVTAAGAASSGVGLLMGKTGAAGGASGLLKGALGAGKGALRAGGLLSVGMAAYDVYTTEQNDSLSRAQKNEVHTAQRAGQLVL